jgi:uridylate kinase
MVHFEGNGRRIALVVGGGLPAREGIELARNATTDADKLDTVGIAATRLNATILQQILLDIGCDVAPEIPTTTQRAADLLDEYHIVLMGGTVPGHTTDAVAVSLARDSSASHVVIATNVSHVYSDDPRSNPDAEAFTMMSFSELVEITGIERAEPGVSAVIDPIAVGLAQSMAMRIAVLDGRELSRLEAAIEGKEFEGTIIS